MPPCAVATHTCATFARHDSGRSTRGRRATSHEPSIPSSIWSARHRSHPRQVRYKRQGSGRNHRSRRQSAVWSHRLTLSAKVAVSQRSFRNCSLTGARIGATWGAPPELQDAPATGHHDRDRAPTDGTGPPWSNPGNQGGSGIRLRGRSGRGSLPSVVSGDGFPEDDFVVVWSVELPDSCFFAVANPGVDLAGEGVLLGR